MNQNLEYYYDLLNETILNRQDLITGLIPENSETKHAWVRDNVYASLSIWSLSIAYKKLPDDDPNKTKGFILEKSVIKLMRGILQCYMLQSNKVERFKQSQNRSDALHAKFNSTNFQTVVGDNDWGHLQIDSVSLYILTIAQMITSGLKIIWTLDEVAFIQNLVFCIEAAYRIPDFGIWGRGDRTNHGITELNTSSIGMAKAALEAISELDLFGASATGIATIHIIPDECQQCNTVLMNILPRESNSKEIDAALLGIISYPCFAVDDPDLINYTRNLILSNLLGNYGCKRFPRDGYKSAREDPTRSYYENGELYNFEGIEPEWPMFFVYLMISGVFNNDMDYVKTCEAQLNKIIIKKNGTIKTDEVYPIMPELFTLQADHLTGELVKPHSQPRIAMGQTPHLWGQSLYILSKLLIDSTISPGEIDPLGRRMIIEPKPDLVVQVVILAENQEIKNTLAEHDLDIQTFSEAYDETKILIYPANVLINLYKQLGVCEKLGLSGRASKEVGIMSTSRLYKVVDHIIAFTPQFTDHHAFYLSLDVDFILDSFRTSVAFLKKSWSSPGRPILLIPAYDWFFQKNKADHLPSLISTIKKIKSGYINGTRVELGNLNNFLGTSCLTKLNFLKSTEVLDDHSDKSFFHQRLPVSPRISRVSTTNMPDINENYQRFSMRRKSMALVKAINLNLGNESKEIFTKKLLLSNPSKKIEKKTFDRIAYSQSPSGKGFTSPEASTKHPTAEELVELLQKTDCIAEQSEILDKLKYLKGLHWDTGLNEEGDATIENLLKEVFEKASQNTQWFILRYTAGLLERQPEVLDKSLTDILVLQKQVTVGLPPEPREKIITEPLPASEIARVIREACEDDCIMEMVTQEIIVYLAMIARTTPGLLKQMLRLRISLIIEMMCSELARTMKKTANESLFCLFNTSPIDMKRLLVNLISGNEFRSRNVPKLIDATSPMGVKSTARRSSLFSTDSIIEPVLNRSVSHHEKLNSSNNTKHTWLRRRKTDGALNRVPPGFYCIVHGLLKRVDGLSIAGKVILKSLTTEMTKEENKFALCLESFMNSVPTPEYRQLIVEALMVLGQMVKNDLENSVFLNYIFNVEDLVGKANRIFLQDQLKYSTEHYKCCASKMDMEEKSCVFCGPHNICQDFYNTPPAGRYGTMAYMVRALTESIRNSIHNHPQINSPVINCNVS